MGLTIAEKILLKHINRHCISPGEFIWAKVDLLLGNDVTTPLAIDTFERLKSKSLFDSKRIVLVLDHFTPSKDILSAQNCKRLRAFAKKYNIAHFYDAGRIMGIEHALLPELGLISPGDLIIGADSHTCTYGALGAFSTGVGSTDLAAAFATGRAWFRVPESIKFIYSGSLNKWVGGKDLILSTIADIGVEGAHYKVMEFSGEAIRRLSMDDRFAMCNMAIEAGAKTGVIEPDEVTLEYLKKISNLKSQISNLKNLKSDENATYCEIKEYNVSKLEPQVALPHLPSNVRPVSKVRNVRIDQVLIGSCTNGRLSDLRAAATILRGKKVSAKVRLIVIPATHNVYFSALRQGWIEIFTRAGGVVSPPTCGPCLGAHMGVLAEGERALATTNRNFRGRMGHPDSEIYLCNPAVAAASAITGKITHPEDI